jgi:Uma2 family endonuclease
VGEYEHGQLQLLLGYLFLNNREAWRVRAVTEVRTQVSRTRFRVPDLSVLRADAPKEAIITHPQWIVIEILSPEDRLSRMAEKFQDYLAFGVENIWVFDPAHRQAWTIDGQGQHLVENDELRVADSPILIVPSQVFAGLD